MQLTKPSYFLFKNYVILIEIFKLKNNKVFVLHINKIKVIHTKHFFQYRERKERFC